MGARVRGQASDTRLWEPAENSSTLNIALTFSFPIAKDRERCVRIVSTISATLYARRYRCVELIHIP